MKSTACSGSVSFYSWIEWDVIVMLRISTMQKEKQCIVYSFVNVSNRLLWRQKRGTNLGKVLIAKKVTTINKQSNILSLITDELMAITVRQVFINGLYMLVMLVDVVQAYKCGHAGITAIPIFLIVCTGTLTSIGLYRVFSQQLER